jgi:hypothetical protein
MNIEKVDAIYQQISALSKDEELILLRTLVSSWDIENLLKFNKFVAGLMIDNVRRPA